MRSGAWATLARRLVTLPLLALACAAALASAPLWVPAAAGLDLLRRSGGVALRSGAFVSIYLVCELLGLCAAFALWLARPLVRWDAARSTALHFRLQDWWGATLLAAALRCFDLRLELEGAHEARLGDGPYLLFLRHASSGDTLLASALIGRPYGLRLRYVLKRELLWDPCLDVVGRRLPHVFVERASRDPEREVARVRALAQDLGAGDGVLIYPEGTRFSEGKRTRLLERLAREGRSEEHAYASSLRCVLPPRAGGALALLDAAPDADVVVCAHAGFEGAATLAQVWKGELLRRTVRVRFERVPRARIPQSRDAREAWLRALWRDVDAWVGSCATPSSAPMAAARRRAFA